MDLLRTTIKCLFYEVGPEEALENVRDSSSKGCEEKLVDPLIERLKASKTNYAPEAIESLRDYIRSEWMDVHNKRIHSNTYYGYVLGVLNYFAENILIPNSNVPLARFDKLLRWKDIALYVGEDLLIASCYARLGKLTDYEWVSPIRHDNADFNSFWDNESFCDVHSHINGCFDSADLSWIYYMNHPENKSWEYILASWLRLYLYNCVCEEQNVNDTFKVLNEKVQMTDDELKASIPYLSEIINAEWDNVEEPLKDNSGQVWDYAIRTSGRKLQSLYAGERRLLHNMLKMVYSGEGAYKKLHSIIYLYLILKTSHRKQFVQTKQLLGLDNYRNYYHKIDDLMKDWLKSDFFYRYGVQSSIRQGTADVVEVRMSCDMGKAIMDDGIRHDKPFLKDQTDVQQSEKINVRHILNIIKPVVPQSCTNRFSIIRKTLYSNILSFINTTKMVNDIALSDENVDASITVPICGLDTASSDLRICPSVIAPFIRYAILRGTTNVTYHIAEEFHDILDGLRMVYEYLTFVEKPEKMRLGHANALGINPELYYNRITHNVICGRLVLIDNLVWFIMYCRTIDKPLEEELEKMFLSEINYHFSLVFGESMTFNIESYWLSMHLRGDLDIVNADLQDKDGDLEQSRFCQNELAIKARESKEAIALNDIYENPPQKAFEIVLYRMPSSALPFISIVQNSLLEKVQSMNCMIESCPTSNLIIGPFEKYNELPIKKFCNIRDLSISINTDTKGIFATSLYEEYSLMAVSMQKDGMDMNNQIIPLMKRIASNAKKQLFEPITVS